MYADKITDSMQRTMDETSRRREIQVAYNTKHNITPRQIVKSMGSIIGQTAVAGASGNGPKPYIEQNELNLAADPVVKFMTTPQLEKALLQTRKSMEKAAKELDFFEAARLRDEMFALQELLKGHK
jgi:excinuclease ABC subunit B